MSHQEPLREEAPSPYRVDVAPLRGFETIHHVILNRPLIVTFAVALGVLASATACRPGTSTGSPGGTPPSATAPGGSGATEAAPGGGGTASAKPAPSASPVLANGRYAVYLVNIDAGANLITFDLIEFLTGDAANKAWQKANPNSGEDSPPNDYFIVNDNPQLRTLPVTGDASVHVLKNDGGSPESYAINFFDLSGYLAKTKTDDRRLSYNPFWLSVQNGQIVKIDEQFVP